MTKKDNRLIQLLSILKTQNGASLRELAKMLNVSEMTIRRDLEILSEKNFVNVVHGAAIFNQQNNVSIDNSKYVWDSEKIYNTKEKNAIGLKAATMVNPNDVIIIDTGTTTQFFAKHLPDFPLTVLCYNTNILFEILDKKSINLIFAGGYYHENTKMFQSLEGLKLIERTCASKAFISASGISNRLGVTTVEQYEMLAKQAVINSAISKILLVDSTKFNKIKPALFAQITDFDTIITDSGIPNEWISFIKDLAVELIIAET